GSGGLYDTGRGPRERRGGAGHAGGGHSQVDAPGGVERGPVPVPGISRVPGRARSPPQTRHHQANRPDRRLQYRCRAEISRSCKRAIAPARRFPPGGLGQYLSLTRMDILITEDLQSAALDQLGHKYKILREPSLWKDAARLKTAAAQARALIVRNQTQVSAEVLANAPNLIAIGRVGVGLDNIDVASATKLGAVVVAPLNANAVSVAELTMGLVLALARKLASADRSTKAGGWDRKACTGIELDGKWLGLCGFGRIGRLVGARARAFGMRLAVFYPYVKPDAAVLLESQAQYCGRLEELLAAADFVSVHMPLTPETRH